jgi:hypothetical protein
MPGNPEECKEHAKRCWALASQTSNPVLREAFLDLAHRWLAVATDLEYRRLKQDWDYNTLPKKSGQGTR